MKSHMQSLAELTRSLAPQRKYGGPRSQYLNPWEKMEQTNSNSASTNSWVPAKSASQTDYDILFSGIQLFLVG